MKYRVSILLLLLSFCCFQNQLMVQHKVKGEKLSKELSLTEEQQARIESIFKEQRDAHVALTKDVSRDDRKEIRNSFKTKIAEILTEEQMVRALTRRS